MSSTTPFGIEGHLPGRQGSSSMEVPGFKRITKWPAGGQPLTGWMPSHIADSVPPLPAPDRLAGVRREIIRAGGATLEATAGMSLGLFTAIMLLPRLHLTFTALLAMLIGAVLLGGIVGAIIHEIHDCRVTAKWKAYDQALATSGPRMNFIAADDTVITAARDTLNEAARAEAAAADWPDLIRSLPDVRTLASSACHARICARQAADELMELQYILAGTHEETDDLAVAAVRARSGDLTAAAQRASAREAAAVDALREAGEAVAQVIALARARAYLRA